MNASLESIVAGIIDHIRLSSILLACGAALSAGSLAAAQSELPADAGVDELAAFGPKGDDPDEEFGARQRKPAEPEAPAEEAAPAAAEEKRIHFRFAADWTSAYYFRGIRQEDDGFIFQPSAELSFDLASWEGGSFKAFFGTWNSFHDEETGVPQGEESDFSDTWYEADLYGGVAVTLGNFGFSALYTTYTSPSDAWETIDEVILGASYDDSSLWGESGFALNPSLTFAIETSADYADGADTQRGIYLQPGLSPGFSATLPLLQEVDFAFPIVVGLSLDDYYEDSTGEDNAFGYVSVGGKMTFGLPIPSSFGDWKLSLGVYGLFLGDTTKEFNDDDETEVIGSVGISIEF